MEEFVSQAASSLGISPESTRSATGGLLQLIKSQSDGADFSTLLEKVPGADALLESAPAEEGEKSGGLLGGLLSKAGSALGVGSALNLTGVLQKAGLDLEQSGGFVAKFVGFLKDKAGSDLIGRVLGKIPELKKLVG